MNGEIEKLKNELKTLDKRLNDALAEKDSWRIEAEKLLVEWNWLERNILNLSHDRAICSVDMSGNKVTVYFHNEARGSGGGPSSIKIRARTVRDSVRKAMAWKKSDGLEERVKDFTF